MEKSQFSRETFVNRWVLGFDLKWTNVTDVWWEGVVEGATESSAPYGAERRTGDMVRQMEDKDLREQMEMKL